MPRGIFGNRKVREGVVVSDKMEKTVVVAVSNSVRDRLYKKIVRRQRHYMAHDDENDARLGDTVRIVEARPYSRKKRWKLAEVLVRADRPEVAPEEIDLELLGEVKPEEEEAPVTPAGVEPAPEPVAEVPAVEPVAEEPVAEEPVAEEPAPAEIPAVEEAVAEPEAPEEEPPAEEPLTEEPVVEEPAPDPIAEEPPAEEATVEEPAAEGDQEKDA